MAGKLLKEALKLAKPYLKEGMELVLSKSGDAVHIIKDGTKVVSNLKSAASVANRVKTLANSPTIGGTVRAGKTALNLGEASPGTTTVDGEPTPVSEVTKDLPNGVHQNPKDPDFYYAVIDGKPVGQGKGKDAAMKVLEEYALAEGLVRKSGKGFQRMGKKGFVKGVTNLTTALTDDKRIDTMSKEKKANKLTPAKKEEKEATADLLVAPATDSAYDKAVTEIGQDRVDFINSTNTKVVSARKGFLAVPSTKVEYDSASARDKDLYLVKGDDYYLKRYVMVDGDPQFFMAGTNKDLVLQEAYYNRIVSSIQSDYDYSGNNDGVDLTTDKDGRVVKIPRATFTKLLNGAKAQFKAMSVGDFDLSPEDFNAMLSGPGNWDSKAQYDASWGRVEAYKKFAGGEYVRSMYVYNEQHFKLLDNVYKHKGSLQALQARALMWTMHTLGARSGELQSVSISDIKQYVAGINNNILIKSSKSTANLGSRSIPTSSVSYKQLMKLYLSQIPDDYKSNGNNTVFFDVSTRKWPKDNFGSVYKYATRSILSSSEGRGALITAYGGDPKKALMASVYLSPSMGRKFIVQKLTEVGEPIEVAAGVLGDTKNVVQEHYQSSGADSRTARGLAEYRDLGELEEGGEMSAIDELNMRERDATISQASVLNGGRHFESTTLNDIFTAEKDDEGESIIIPGPTVAKAQQWKLVASDSSGNYTVESLDKSKVGGKSIGVYKRPFDGYSVGLTSKEEDPEEAPVVIPEDYTPDATLPTATDETIQEEFNLAEEELPVEDAPEEDATEDHIPELRRFPKGPGKGIVPVEAAGKPAPASGGGGSNVPAKTTGVPAKTTGVPGKLGNMGRGFTLDGFNQWDKIAGKNAGKSGFRMLKTLVKGIARAGGRIAFGSAPVVLGVLSSLEEANAGFSPSYGYNTVGEAMRAALQVKDGVMAQGIARRLIENNIQGLNDLLEEGFPIKEKEELRTKLMDIYHSEESIPLTDGMSASILMSMNDYNLHNSLVKELRSDTDGIYDETDVALLQELLSITDNMPIEFMKERNGLDLYLHTAIDQFTGTGDSTDSQEAWQRVMNNYLPASTNDNIRGRAGEAVRKRVHGSPSGTRRTAILKHFQAKLKEGKLSDLINYAALQTTHAMTYGNASSEGHRRIPRPDTSIVDPEGKPGGVIFHSTPGEGVTIEGDDLGKLRALMVISSRISGSVNAHLDLPSGEFTDTLSTGAFKVEQAVNSTENSGKPVSLSTDIWEFEESDLPRAAIDDPESDTAKLVADLDKIAAVQAAATAKDADGKDVGPEQAAAPSVPKIMPEPTPQTAINNSQDGDMQAEEAADPLQSAVQAPATQRAAPAPQAAVSTGGGSPEIAPAVAAPTRKDVIAKAASRKLPGRAPVSDEDRLGFMSKYAMDRSGKYQGSDNQSYKKVTPLESGRRKVKMFGREVEVDSTADAPQGSKR